LWYSYETCGTADAWTNNGKSTCQCAKTPSDHPFKIGSTGRVTIKTGEPLTDYEYPNYYGFNICNTHDTFLSPFCATADGKVKADAPAWCTKKWCFVDKSTATDCGDADGPEGSSYFKREGATLPNNFYYSYETCGDKDEFTGSDQDNNKDLAVKLASSLAAFSMMYAALQ
jgi:hypothetical protein